MSIGDGKNIDGNTDTLGGIDRSSVVSELRTLMNGISLNNKDRLELTNLIEEITNLGDIQEITLYLEKSGERIETFDTKKRIDLMISRMKQDLSKLKSQIVSGNISKETNLSDPLIYLKLAEKGRELSNDRVEELIREASEDGVIGKIVKFLS